MDRRKFLSTLGLGAAAATVAGCGQTDCGPEGSSDGRRYRWKLVTTWPKKLSRPWHQSGALCQSGAHHVERAHGYSCVRCQ